jgi:hypothetical protein
MADEERRDYCAEDGTGHPNCQWVEDESVVEASRTWETSMRRYTRQNSKQRQVDEMAMQ